MPAIKIKFKYTQRIQYIRSATVEVKRLEAYDNHSQGSKVKINSTIKGKQLPNLRKRDQPQGKINNSAKMSRSQNKQT